MAREIVVVMVEEFALPASMKTIKPVEAGLEAARTIYLHEVGSACAEGAECLLHVHKALCRHARSPPSC